jgi:hypothetical protein
MSTLSIRIPDSIHEIIKRMSKEDNISINQFIASAITEKVTAFETEDYIKNRGMLGDKKAFEKVLNKVPNIEPEKFDK